MVDIYHEKIKWFLALAWETKSLWLLIRKPIFSLKLHFFRREMAISIKWKYPDVIIFCKNLYCKTKNKNSKTEQNQKKKRKNYLRSMKKEQWKILPRNLQSSVKVPVLVMCPLLWLNTTIKSNLGGQELFDLQTQLIVDGNQGMDKHCSLPFLLSCSACFLIKPRITTHIVGCVVSFQ